MKYAPADGARTMRDPVGRAQAVDRSSAARPLDRASSAEGVAVFSASKHEIRAQNVCRCTDIHAQCRVHYRVTIYVEKKTGQQIFGLNQNSLKKKLIFKNFFILYSYKIQQK